MIRRLKESIRAKFTLIFIGILCFSCICSFGIVYLFAFKFIKSTILDISVNYTNDQLKEIILLMIITLTICSIIGSTLMYFATKFISKPIKYVSNSTKEVSKGDFNGFIDYDSEDEIGVLARNFNIMTSELNNIEYLRKDFISNVSHEFKTPIASIHGFVEMIKDKNLPERKRDEYIDIIIEETERLSNLSSNMLKISKLDNQNIPNKMVEFSLDEQIRKIILLLENKWNKKNLELDINLEKIIFKGDEELLQQIWINLIENAIKFSKESGLLSVELNNLEDNIVVKVSDTGIGMSEDNKKRVFERFYQGESSHSQEGNGLGLAIVKRIVEICNGKIKIESVIDRGTTFIIILPKYNDIEIKRRCNEMNLEQKRKLLKAQQGELDAVILYRKLARVVKDKELKDQFLKVAADEGKHASILKEYTGEVLKPKSIKANIVITIYKALGHNFTLNMLANGEIKSIDKYNELVLEFPNIQKIIEDEQRHAEIGRSFLIK